MVKIIWVINKCLFQLIARIKQCTLSTHCTLTKNCTLTTHRHLFWQDATRPKSHSGSNMSINVVLIMQAEWIGSEIKFSINLSIGNNIFKYLVLNVYSTFKNMVCWQLKLNIVDMIWNNHYFDTRSTFIILSLELINARVFT